MVLSFLKNIYYNLIRNLFRFSLFLRRKNIDFYYPYSGILCYKNKHRGERCFIIGTGPSLKIKDLDALKNEISFSMNSIILSFPETTWRPTYYVIQDGRAYKLLKDKIFINDVKKIFIGVGYRRTGIWINKFKDKKFFSYKYFPLYHTFSAWNEKIGFSNDVYNKVFDGWTVTYSIMQLAIYMGFKEIYLLGIDCDYTSSEKSHIVDYVENHNTDSDEIRMVRSYEIAKKFADENGVKIYNASEKGKLDVFERVKLDSVI